MFRQVLLTGIVSLSVVASSCTSTTTINSKPQGATLMINGNEVGQTPFRYSDTKVLFSKQQVSLTMKGYRELEGFIQRDSLSAGYLV